jgi:hypothetical protein
MLALGVTDAKEADAVPWLRDNGKGLLQELMVHGVNASVFRSAAPAPGPQA